MKSFRPSTSLCRYSILYRTWSPSHPEHRVFTQGLVSTRRLQETTITKKSARGTDIPCDKTYDRLRPRLPRNLPSSILLLHILVVEPLTEHHRRIPKQEAASLLSRFPEIKRIGVILGLGRGPGEVVGIDRGDGVFGHETAVREGVAVKGLDGGEAGKGAAAATVDYGIGGVDVGEGVEVLLVEGEAEEGVELVDGGHCDSVAGGEEDAGRPREEADAKNCWQRKRSEVLHCYEALRLLGIIVEKDGKEQAEVGKLQSRNFCGLNKFTVEAPCFLGRSSWRRYSWSGFSYSVLGFFFRNIIDVSPMSSAQSRLRTMGRSCRAYGKLWQRLRVFAPSGDVSGEMVRALVRDALWGLGTMICWPWYWCGVNSAASPCIADASLCAFTPHDEACRRGLLSFGTFLGLSLSSRLWSFKGDLCTMANQNSSRKSHPRSLVEGATRRKTRSFNHRVINSPLQLTQQATGYLVLSNFPTLWDLRGNVSRL